MDTFDFVNALFYVTMAGILIAAALAGLFMWADYWREKRRKAASGKLCSCPSDGHYIYCPYRPGGDKNPITDKMFNEMMYFPLMEKNGGQVPGDIDGSVSESLQKTHPRLFQRRKPA